MALSMRKQQALTFICLGLAGIGTSQAEIKLLDGQHSGDWWKRLDLEFGGSIRFQYVNAMGSVDDGSHMHKGYDGGSRLRLNAKYHFNDDTSLIFYYEPGLDVPKLLHMYGHYNSESSTIHTRMRYYGIESKKWGTLTYGRQDTPYYYVIGAKTDVWNNDMNAQGPGAGLDGAYDGSDMARKTLQYFNTFGPVDFYLAGQLPTHSANQSNGQRYKRKGGAALGLNYHLNDAIELAAGYHYTNSDIKGPGEYGQFEKKNEDQHIIGAAFSYDSGPWYGAFTSGYYRNFVPATGRVNEVNNFFAKESYGLEAIVSYKFEFDGLPALTALKPYAAADRLQVTNGRHYQNTNEFVGVSFYFQHGFQLDLERTFTQSTDHLADENWARVRFDF